MMNATVVDPWSEIRREFENEIRSIGIPKKFRKGELIFEEKKPYQGFFEIISGMFKVFSLNQDGKEAILKVFSPGELIASHPIFQSKEPCIYPGFCEALKDGELIYYPRKEFVSFLTENNRALFLFSSAVVEHLNYFRKKMMENLFLSVKDRIVTFLLESGADQGFVSLPVTKYQLASLIGTTPESVSRAFRSLIEDCLIEEKGSSYHVLRKSN
ncbi:Crp/Fnr family transcriptional regulator [Leptospira langatensis]|uniref:Crp/Fnr family transcriptional regulator n=1 Tax=Leptospira langatensis TaxID=2484983 RepID=A0A5F1ZNW4_9LEPT|nr:Crp/Fnr family transcriptional regulator [Leptospira langatensis]TGK05206.1 Crp/Fnr family transcriptional regulator [Leptospira langatensis]TGL38341.1 Crp/Fnr family transcriptional regulator [Leptospira langatensis]